MTFKVSHSKVKTWRRCRKAYDYRYVQKLRPRRKGRPLVFGSIVHEMIEAHANGDSPQDVLTKYRKDVKKLFSAERDEYLQIVTDAELLMVGYFRKYEKDKLKFIAIKRKLAEHEFSVPLTDGIILEGKVDALARKPDKTVWMVEHKSHKEVPGEDVRLRDLQTVIYETVLVEHGFVERIDGILWDYIRSKPPTIPRLLKDGSMSQAAIDTTPEVYRQALIDAKLDPKKYKDMLKSLEKAADSFYQRVYMPLNRTMSKQLMGEFITTSKEMRDCHGKDATRNLTKDCSWCEYRQLCTAELLGNDADFIRSREFTTGEKK